MTTLPYYSTFASTYGSSMYSTTTYNGTAATSAGGTTGTTTNTGSTSTGVASTGVTGVLTNTGAMVGLSVGMASLLVFAALAVKLWRRPQRQTAAETVTAQHNS